MGLGQYTYSPQPENKMPSAVVENETHGNRSSVVKRKKIDGGGSSSRSKGGYSSRLFAPFRVSGSDKALLRYQLTCSCIDDWPCLFDICAVHLNPAREDNLPDHYLSRKMFTDL